MSKKATDKTTGRQVWDKEYHRERAVTASTREKEALERLGGDVLAVLGKEKKHKEPPPPEERKNLVHRDYDLKLDHKLGKKQIITASTPKPYQGGFWCDTCECLIKDSLAWLDHINGRRHNKLLGFSMRVDNVTVGQVKRKLRTLREESDTPAIGVDDVCDDIEERLKVLRDREFNRKKKKKEKKMAKKICDNKIEEGDGKVRDTSGEMDTHANSDDEESEQTMQMKLMGLPVGFQ
eukprot:GHVR01023711.1.p1 GENE.GHVR01023711.1~~GHVR01023711.1.p1  ORF type:complete len:236 (+),score=88.06 GHVR01023711.1:176-883(+)